jgi:hypothetical protein
MTLSSTKGHKVALGIEFQPECWREHRQSNHGSHLTQGDLISIYRVSK